MNHDFFYREWNWIEQLSAAFHVFAANIKPILKVLLIVFLPISILESIINGRMLNAYTVFQQIAQAGVSLSNEADFFQAAYQVLFHSGLTLLVGLFLQPVGTIAIAKMVKQFVTKQEISFGTALGEAFSLMPTIVFSGIIYGVLIFLSSYSFFPNARIGNAVYQFLCYFSAAFVTVGQALLFLNREAVTYGIPTEPAAEDAPAESVTGTVEGEPTENEENKE